MFRNKKTLITSLIVIALIVVTFVIQRPEFDVDQLNSENVIKHVSHLTSNVYTGRLTGSEGNLMAMRYVEDYFSAIDLEPAGDAGGYQQALSVLVPQVDPDSEFSIIDVDNRAITTFEIYRDYAPVFSPNGGPIKFLGDYVVLGSDAYRADPELIKNKIAVVDATRITPKLVAHIMDVGGKGILCSSDTNAYSSLKTYERTKAMDVSGKGGESIFVGYVSRDTYTALKKSESTTIRLNVSVTFPILETANLLAKLQGKSKNGETLILSANLDSLGEGLDGQYFPGAVSSATSVGILLETARLTKESQALPYETVIIAVWNGDNQGQAGVQYYIDNPIYPLEKTKVIHLEGIGKATLEGLSVAPDPLNGTLIADLIVKYAKDRALMANVSGSKSDLSSRFLNKKVPTVVFSDSMATQNTYEDNFESVDIQTIENTANVLLTYLKREVYGERKIEYLKYNEMVLLSILALLGGLTFVFGAYYYANSNAKIGKLNLETIYYSTGSMVVRKFFSSVLPYIVVVFLLAMLVNIDPNANMARVNGEVVSNVSFFLIVKSSFLYLRQLMSLDFYASDQMGELVKVLIESSKLSVLLVAMSLILSTVIGILSGMVEAYRSRKTSIGSLGALIFFSIPEILIVLGVLLGYTKLVVHFPELKGSLPMKEFILPLLTLSIVPTVYISRMTFIAIQEEMAKDYIKNEKAKGFSRRKIIFVELLPAVIFKIIDTMPALMTMLLSNMIIIEYLFNYKGILYFLVYLYNRQDVFRFVPLALVLGLIYVVFTGAFKWMAKIINPMKRRGDI